MRNIAYTELSFRMSWSFKSCFPEDSVSHAANADTEEPELPASYYPCVFSPQTVAFINNIMPLKIKCIIKFIPNLSTCKPQLSTANKTFCNHPSFKLTSIMIISPFKITML